MPATTTLPRTPRPQRPRADVRLRHCMIVDNGWPDVRVEREALALLARGHRVDVICARAEPGEPRTEVVDGIRLFRLPVMRRRGSGIGQQMLEYAAFTLWAAAELTRLQLRHRYNVVQVHNVPDFLVAAAIPAKLSGTPVILDLHDLMPEFFASRVGAGLDALPVRLVRVAESVSRSLADHVITVTEGWRQTLVERGADPARTSVVMNVPDADLYPHRLPEPAVARDGPIRLVYHGTLTRRYAVDLLLEAVAAARQRVDLRMLLHGRGELVPELPDIIGRLGLDDVVTLSTQMLPAAELASRISTADIGIVPLRPDLFTDGILPTKLMEYAALGIPAIVARTSATEAAFDGSMVRFVPPADVAAIADAIVELATDPELRYRLAVNAQAFTASHPWSAEAERYTTIVEHLASRATRPHRVA